MEKNVIKKRELIIFLILSLYFTSFLILQLGSIEINDNFIVMYGIVCMYMFFLILKWPNNGLLILFGGVCFLLIKIYYIFNLDPITGPDALGYYNQTLKYTSLSDFFEFALSDIKERGLMDTSSYTIFGLVYMPFYTLFGIESPNFIIILNSMLAIGVIFTWCKINEKFGEEKTSDGYLSLLVFFLLISPSISYFSSVFLKDMANLFFITLSVYFLFKRKYVLALLFCVVAISFRPYAIVTVFCYYVFIKRKVKWTLAGLLAALFYVFLKLDFIGVVNVFSNLGYVVFSPNPIDFENWLKHPTQTLESSVFIVSYLIFTVTFILKKELRGFLFNLLFVLLIYSCVLTLVGESSLSSKGLEYGLFKGGDDFFRKKLPMVLITYSVLSFIINGKFKGNNRKNHIEV